MALNPAFTPDGEWCCARCGGELEQKQLSVVYLGSSFDVSLPVCSQCGQSMVPESLALGKMAEVEALLEDK